MTRTDEAASLRRSAEQLLHEQPASKAAGSEADALNPQRLVHELQVHRIELEMQNGELLEARSALETTLSRYTELYDFAPVSYFTFDRNGTIRQVNLAGAHLLGSERLPLIGLPFVNFVAADSRAGFARLLATASTSRQRETADIALHRASLPGQWTFVHIDVVLASSGDSFLAAAMDISATQQAEQALREHETLKSILEATPDRICAVDRQLRITFINRCRADLRVERVLGSDASTYYAPESQALVRQEIQRVFATAAIARFEALELDTLGRSTWYEIIAAPVLRGSEVSSVTLISRDISERKSIAAELDRHRHHLEALVSQRSGEIEELNRQLERRVRESEAANRAKSTFLSNMSHEIRTPMNAIVGLAYILQRHGGLDTEQLDKLGKIIAAAKHLLAIINAILDLSKIEAGKFALEQAEFNLAAMLANLKVLIAEPLESKGLRLLIDTDHLPAVLCGDVTRLSQALLNYLGNAVKFTAHGEIILRASVLEETSDNLLLRFAIEDRGIGVAAEQQERLFAPFEQADNSTTRRFGGTGLGLAINRHLAHLMGGEVGLEARSDGGSIFWLTARLGKAATQSATQKPTQKPTDKPGTPGDAMPVGAAERMLKRDYRSARLLLAEDDEVNRIVAESLLEDVGLRLDMAENGRQAVAMASAVQYDLILMDVQMPVLDGLAATRAIRQLSGYATTPILAMTANALQEDKQECLAAGMNDHVAKPVMPEDLYRSLLKWLEKPALSSAVR